MQFLGLFLRVVFWVLMMAGSMACIAVSLEEGWEEFLPEGYEWAGYLSSFLVVCLWISIIIYYASKWMGAT